MKARLRRFGARGRIATALALAAAMAGVLALQEMALSRDRERLGVLLITNGWYAAQLDFETQRLLGDTLRFEAGEVGPDRLLTRFDILWSRLDLVKQSDFADRPGMAALLQRLELTLADLDPVIGELAPGDISVARIIRAAVEPLEEEIHEVSVTYFGGSGYRETLRAIEDDTFRSALMKGAALLLTGLMALYLVIEIGVSRRAARREAHARIRAEAARRRAERADAARELFLRNVSHELRTPLNGMLGMATVLKSTSLDPMQRRFVDTMAASTEGLTALLGALIEASRLADGPVGLRRERFSLRGLLEEAAALFRPAMAQRGLELRTELAPSLPEHAVGDALRLRHILANLLGNAVKFDRTGPVTLAAEAWSTPQGFRLRVAVSDNGPGVSEKDREQIFDMLVQGDAVDAARPEGIGVGLSVCRRLCQAMNGDIRCEQVSRGARFVFEIDLEAEERVPRPQAA